MQEIIQIYFTNIELFLINITAEDYISEVSSQYLHINLI